MRQAKGFARPPFALAALALIIGLVFGSQIAFAAPPKFSLEQCRNGSATSPNNCLGTLNGGSGWVSGNAGASQAHFVEGHSIPYRGIATDMSTTTGGNITLGYDIKHSGKHAMDFLTHYDRLVPHGAFGHDPETVTPTSGVSGVNTGLTAECDIDKPGNLSTGASTTFNAIVAQGKAVFTVFGATSCETAVGTAGDVTAAQSEATIVVTWSCPCSSTMVFAWGGHIARSADWLPAGGAAGISGSPYHMRTNAWSVNNIGNQDRSLSAAAVVAEQASVVTRLQELDDDGNPTANVGASITVDLGDTVRDTAAVTPGEATGSVVFRYYSSLEACQADTAGAGGTEVGTAKTLPGSGTNTVASDSVTLGAGDYWWRAFYTATGDFISAASPCDEQLTVSKGTPTITTVIHETADHTTNYDRNASGNSTASLPASSQVHDVAFVTGVTGVTPTGAISFTMWSNGTCDGDGSALSAGGADEAGSGTRSVDTSALAPGDYSFKATIAADTNYNTNTSPCESLKIDKGVPAMTTAPWFYPQDSATLSGLLSPQTGSTVTFTLHTASDCSAQSQVYSEVINDIGNTTYNTDNDEYAVTSDATVYWKVVYSGDANNEGKTSDCAESIAATIVTDPPAEGNGGE